MTHSKSCDQKQCTHQIAESRKKTIFLKKMELFIFQPTLVTTERPMASIINDLGGYECDFLESPPDALLCLICTFVAREPMQMNCCGRVYCKHCLTENRKRSTACPNCRKQGNGFFDRKSEREVNALKVRCDNFKNGCKWTWELAALDKHLTTCDHALLPCPNECKKESADITQLLRKDLESHLKDNCPNRSYECPHCKKKGKHYYVASTHLESCPKVAITCPNKDCGEEIIRCDITEHLTECPFHMVPCKYTKIGCGEKRIRKEIEDHEKHTESHFHLAMETVVKLKDKNEKKRFKMLGFSKYKASGKFRMSPQFYTHQEGYKMSICVIANGNDDGEGTHVSVYASLVKGKFDDNLTWPFTGSVTVTLLNQLEDNNHHQSITEYPEGTDNGTNRRVLEAQKSQGYGDPCFICHDALAYDPVTNCQYLKNDCLCFEVSVRADSCKPWLAPTM